MPNQAVASRLFFLKLYFKNILEDIHAGHPMFLTSLTSTLPARYMGSEEQDDHTSALNSSLSCWESYVV